MSQGNKKADLNKVTLMYQEALLVLLLFLQRLKRRSRNQQFLVLLDFEREPNEDLVDWKANGSFQLFVVCNCRLLHLYLH